MKTASWGVIAFAGIVLLFFSLLSAKRAYGTFNDQMGGVSVAKLSEGRPDVDTAVRSRRATAAAFSTGFATLLLLITFIPYRRGEVWAWWALAIGMLVVAVVILLRVPLLGTGLGGSSGGGTASGSITLLVLVGVGLALGAGRLRQSSN